jgi:predicted PurR-regulated permease PerM
MNFLRLPFLVKLTLVVLFPSLDWLSSGIGTKYFSSFFLCIPDGDAVFTGSHFYGKKLRFPRSMSTMTSVFIMLMILGGIIYFFTNQLSDFSKDLPHLKEQFTTVFNNLQHWVSKHLM